MIKYIRFLFKRKWLKFKVRQHLSYYNFYMINSIYNWPNPFQSKQLLYLENLFLITQKRKQYHLTFASLLLNKILTFSAGFLLCSFTRCPKSFKKDIISILPLILILKVKFLDFFELQPSILCTNFNYRIYFFLTKLFYFCEFTPTMMFFVNSYRFQAGYKRRIKRTILKTIKNQ